jgi:hypothetical protein
MSAIIFDEFHERSLHADLALSSAANSRNGAPRPTIDRDVRHLAADRWQGSWHPLSLKSRIPIRSVSPHRSPTQPLPQLVSGSVLAGARADPTGGTPLPAGEENATHPQPPRSRAGMP